MHRNTNDADDANHDADANESRPSALLGVAKFLGIGALVAGGLTVVLWLLAAVVLIGPLIFWLAWNQLGLGPSMGLPELGFWPIVGATLFLCLGWFGKAMFTGVVFLIEPAWLADTAVVSWPEPTLRNLLAVALLAMLAARPHSDHHRRPTRSTRTTRPAKHAAPKRHVASVSG
ncbi:MAG: hypothetical protein ACKV2O_21460 [Acidimicrobiales bacterium]